MNDTKIVHVEIDLKGASEEDVHRQFSEALGFAGWYGNNWNAWIDIMRSLDDPGYVETAYPSDTIFLIELSGYEDFEKRHPSAYHLLLQCAADVNAFRLSHGDFPYLIIAHERDLR